MGRSRQSRRGELDAAVRRLAGRQHGVVSRAQLLALGMGSGAVDHRVANARLVRVHSGVFALGEPTREGRWLAAVLACGPGAVLSHHAAAALWRIRSVRARRIDVSVPRARSVSRPGIALQRCELNGNTTRLARIPVTTPQRTIIDLAPDLTPRELERATDEARYLGLLTASSLRAAVQRNRGRPGVAALRRLLRTHEPGSTRTRSGLEEAFLRICATYGIPRPLVNQRIDTIEVDFTWPRHGLAVETDAFATHRSRHAFEADRRREPILRAAGYRLRRFTDTQVHEQPASVAEEVRAELGLGDQRSPGSP